MARKPSVQIRKIKTEYIHSDKSIKQLADEYGRDPQYLYRLSSKEKWTQQKRDFLNSLQFEANTEIKRMYVNAAIRLFEKNLSIYEDNLNSLSQIPVMEDKERVSLAIRLPQVLMRMQELDPNTLKVQVEDTQGLDEATKNRLDILIGEIQSLNDAQIELEEAYDEEEDA